MSRSGDSTREQIVVAATRLFYGEGIKAVSMDAVAETAGVTKKTLYYHFTSKDELVAETIAARDQPTLELYMRWFAETDGGAADKVRGLFTKLGRSVNTPRWRGCGFLRTIAELANTPAHPAVKAGAAHKKRFEAWLATELQGHGVADAAALARQIVILLDGATTVMLIHRDLDYVETAGQLALGLVESAQNRRP
ncbi:TetR family transcriptional regulator [Bradyrhizobium sacchari]|uniref:TetR family transcriptional regulator n=1 Tax=Bradyrhizobium sacchari TaxID=1399419 RepID=A0A1V5EXA4_9BRAD|nr:TetR/AcrR family transcriptional regulator [Bradyrhizobium sacchari]OPY93850.1 TetR family transcriptional regulator [Bradyrhizobium sacchari]OPY94349.1 TetR family transcriptional regulator [Bradyrhizobium sacchari]OPY99917.1 TetR family transcriptional regulator [Bradyrhizobium sacchari]TWB53970.1 TetR family transcriptional regulator [Bradyrhizobium sacchari]TWB78418.1 TetR family transcriptional regulator [Bradyrhizobium sacchari]